MYILQKKEKEKKKDIVENIKEMKLRLEGDIARMAVDRQKGPLTLRSGHPVQVNEE